MAGLALTSTDGFELVDQFDGRVVDESCEAGCCDGGDCATLRRWDRRPIADGKLACVNQPVSVWLCEPRLCAGFTGIKYLNACYVPSAVVLPRDQVGASETVLAWGDVQCSNDEDCTECDKFYRAELCGGHNGQGPPLFVRVENVQGCGLVVSPMVVPPRCYTVRAGGPTFTRQQILASGGAGAIIDETTANAPGTDCCDCTLLPCGRNQVGPYTDCQSGAAFFLSCCCPEDYCITVQYAFRQTINFGEGFDAQGVPIVGAQQRVENTVSGSVTACIAGGVTTFTTPRCLKGRIHVTEVPLPGNEVAEDVLYDLCPLGGAGAVLNGGCFAFPTDFPLPTVGVSDFGPGPLCPWQLAAQGPFPDFQLLIAAKVYTCKRATLKGHWKVFDPIRNPPGVARIETTIEAVYTIISGTGPCRGNCGGVVVPVPTPLVGGVGEGDGGGDGGAVVDPLVAKMIERQMVLGGCVGCGEGNGQ